MAMKEWIEHYSAKGADHIYLIDDGSTDDYKEILEPYIRKGFVTLFKNDVVCEIPAKRQCMIYERFFRPVLSQSTWFSVLDLDEFLYCPESARVDEVFKTRNEDEIIIDWVCFGSNGHVKQPESIIDGFTKRYSAETAQRLEAASYKSTFRTNKFLNFGVHKQFMTPGSVSVRASPTFLINHYLVQSENFWTQVKMTRGDVNRWHASDARTLDYFRKYDVNEEDDFRLCVQRATQNTVSSTE